VALAAQVSEATVRAGVSELVAADSSLPVGRSRGPGGGRKPAWKHDPGLVEALLGLVEPDERGDPMSPLRWTCKSVRTLAAELTRQGHAVSHQTVSEVLQNLGYSLQANRKTREGAEHPDRNAQFEHIAKRAKEFQRRGVRLILGADVETVCRKDGRLAGGNPDHCPFRRSGTRECALAAHRDADRRLLHAQ